MRLHTNLLASAAIFTLSAGLAVADAHSEMTAETVVATVDGAEITLGQMIMLRAQLPQEYKELPDDVVFNGMIEQLINQQLLSDSLVDEPKRVGIAIANEIRSLRASAVVNDIASMVPSEEEVQAVYQERLANSQQDPEYNASHILVETEEEARRVKDIIDGGADFAETARENSTGPSGPSGGDLGWFGPGMMVSEFETAVVALEVGEVSDPVQTNFGWHIIRLDDERVTALAPIEVLRGELENTIRQRILEAKISDLTAEAEIVVPEEGQFDFSVIRNLELLED